VKCLFQRHNTLIQSRVPIPGLWISCQKGTSLSSWEVSSIIIINQHAYPLCVHKVLQLRFPANKMLTIIPLAQVGDIIFTPYPTRANEIIVV